MLPPIEQAAYEKWLVDGCLNFGFEMICLIAKKNDQVLVAGSGVSPKDVALARRLQAKFNAELIAHGGVDQTKHFERN